MSAYYTKLKSIWEELSGYRPHFYYLACFFC